MNAIVLHAHKSPISFSFSKQIRTRDPLCPQNGIAFLDLNPPRNSQFREFQLDGYLAITSQKNVLKFSVSSANSDGGRPLQPGRTETEDEKEPSLSSDDKSPKSAKQEKITALFRRIQSSISKAEATRASEINNNLSKKSPTESIQKILHQSQNPVEANTKSRKGNRVLVKKRSGPKKNDTNPQEGNVQLSAASFNVIRPPSNFVKKSPILSPSIPRGKPIEENYNFPAATDQGKVSISPIEKMKLPQLKELAKSRGIKGYSKLKKSKLLELLSY